MNTLHRMALLLFPLTLAACPGPGAFVAVENPPPDDAGMAPPVDAGPVSADAGVDAGQPTTTLPRPAPLEESRCLWRLPAAACADPDGCLVLHRAGLPPQTLLTQSDLGDDTFHFVPGVTDQHFFFATFRSINAPTGVPRLLAVPALGGAPVDVLTLAPGERLNNVEGLAHAADYATWMVTDVAEGNRHTRNLVMFQGHGGSNVAFPGLSGEARSAQAMGTDYLALLPDGIHSFYPAGGSLIVEDATLTAFTADDEHVFVSACADGRCQLKRHGRRTRDVMDLGNPVDESIGSVALLGNHLYALAGRSLFRVPRDGGDVVRMYAGNELPQHPGTLLPSSLRASGGRLYAEEACDLDADAPGYGTLELDVDRASVRWLQDDPAFPFHPQVRAISPWASQPWVNSVGLYTWERPL